MVDLIPIEDAIAWRWRCLSDGCIIFGADLRIAEYPGITLAEWNSSTVDRAKLRCACGGLVVPLAPTEAK